MQMNPIAGVLLLATALVGAGTDAGLGTLQLVDDRGQVVTSPVRVCFQLERRLDCRQVQRGEGVEIPAAVVEISAEGEDHGPVKVRRTEVATAGAGTLRLVVPRKGQLAVRRMAMGAPRPESPPAPTPLALNLYRPDDPTFREPFLRLQLAANETTVRMPAGTFIVSLTEKPPDHDTGTPPPVAAVAAPDLHRLVVAPGGMARLDYQARPGWSLVVRSRAAADGRVIGEAEMKLSETRGYGRPAVPIAGALSEGDGLALFSGLSASLASLAAGHPGFLPAAAHGITAAPGTFAFREVALAVGGRLTAHVTVHGRAMPEAGCEIDAVEAAVPGRDARVAAWQGKTDGAGCVHLAASGGRRLQVPGPHPGRRERQPLDHDRRRTGPR
jgi:hypothetical protein